jgi:membrane-bound ClpP family serine protease
VADSTHHKAKRSSWVAVLLMVIGAALVGLGMVLQSFLIGGAGIAVGLAGVILAMATNIMSDAY